jgi:thiol-disulfide isomerase/thioredoxin
MSSILYYSNFCEKCKEILRTLGKSDTKNDIHFICIDKRFKDQNTNATYVVLENQQKIVLPPQVQKVPAMLLLKEGNKVIFGTEIMNRIKPREEYVNSKATGFNGEPMAFSLGSDNVGGFGVASDCFSYWDQGSDELLAKGNGGTRQMYNYASIDYNSKIETPTDDWSPDKVDESAYKQIEEQRNKDLQIQNMNKPTI